MIRQRPVVRFFNMFYYSEQIQTEGVAYAISANHKLSIDPADRPELVFENKSGYKAVDTQEELGLMVGSSCVCLNIK